jgi:hypothetical protein
MSGPDDIPAEAVEAAAQMTFDCDAGDNPVDWGSWEESTPETQQAYREHATHVLAAALPHLRARILAEVDAALRAKAARHEGNPDPDSWMWNIGFDDAADYLRDVLGGDSGEVG